MKLAVETVDGGVQRLFSDHDDTLDALGGQLHDLHLHSGINPDTLSDPNASLWEGIAVGNGNVDGARQQLDLDVFYLVKVTMSEMRSELLAQAKVEARQKVAASVNLMRNDMHAFRLECRQVSRECGTLDMKMGDVAREQALLNQQPILIPHSLVIGNMFWTSLYGTPLLAQDVLVIFSSMNYFWHHDRMVSLLSMSQQQGL
jgi:hypothetical protein